MNHPRRFLAALCFLSVVGCAGEESMQEKMLRVARERSEIRKQREAEDLAQAKLVATKQNESEADKPVAKDAAKDASSTEKTASKPSTKPSSNSAKPGPDPPPKSQVAANADQPEGDAERVSLAEAETTLPRREDLMTFGRLGKQVAFVGETQSIGVYDVQSKRLTRQVYNPQLTPFSMAIGESGKQIIVGGMDGGLKIFSLESVDGLDKFKRNRMLRSDAAPPRKAHDNPITAVAISDQAGIAATGDSSGEIKLWSSDSEPPLELTGEPGGYSQLLSYQDDQILFAAAENKIVFWQIGNERTASRDFAEAVFDQPLTSMVIGPEAKGLAVGDAGGRVTLWTPEGDDLKKVSFPAHDAPVDGLGFVDNGNTLITVARTGEVARWKLPIEPQRSFDVVESPDFVVSSPDGRIVGLPSRGKNLDIYSLENGSAVRRHSLSKGQLTAAAFSADNDLVALANNEGRVVFQDSNRRTIAYAQWSDDGITRLAASPDQQEQFAFSTANGDVGVASFPQKRVGPLATTGEVAAMNRAGTAIVVGRGTDLSALLTTDGQLTNSGRIEDEQVTALAIDENLALIGTSAGSIWSWAYAIPNSDPEVILKGLHESEILAIGTTDSGRVWSCDAKGATKTTPFQKQQRFDRGSIDVAISAATALREGGVFVLDQDQRLRFAPSVDGPFDAGTNQTWSRIIGRTDRIGAIDQTGRLLEVRSGQSSLEATIRIPSGATIADADIARQTLSILLSDESVLGVNLAVGSSPDRKVAEGTLTRSLISSNGQTSISVDEQGNLLASSASGSARMLDDLKQTTPLAVSPNGNLLICARDGRASCYEISRGATRLVTEFTDQVSEPVTAQFSADLQRIVFALQSGQIVSAPIAEAGKVRKITLLKKLTSGIALDEANNQIACHHADGSLTIIANDSGDVRYDSGAKKFVAFALGGGRTFAGTSEGQVFKLDIERAGMSLLVENLSGGIQALSAADDGRFATAITADGFVVSIDASTGVTVTTSAYQENAKLLAMTVAGDHAVAIDASGRLRSHPIPAITTMAPKSSAIRKISVSGNGNWVLGLRSNGSLIRWNLASGKSSAAMRASFPTKANDIISLGSTAQFAVLTSEQSVSTFDADNDSSTAPQGTSTKTSEILSANSSGMVVLATDEGLRSLNVRGGSVDHLQDEWGKLDKDTHLIAIEGNEQSSWVALKADGTFVKSTRLSSSQDTNDFSLGSPPVDVVIHAGLLISGDSSKINIQREDGSSVGSLDFSDDQVICLAAHDATANVAACDRKGRLAILLTAANETKRSQLPTTKISSLTWSDDGNYIAATDGHRVVTINSKTGRIESQLMFGDKITELVGWNEDQLWFFDGSSRLQSMHLPTVRWKQSVGSKPISLAWSATGKNLVALIGSGNVLKFDSNGHEQARVAVGKDNLRSLLAIPNSDGFAFLADNDIHLFDAQGQVAKLPISSAIGLRTLCCSSDGRYLFASNDIGQILSWDLTSLESAAEVVPCEVHCDSLAIADGSRVLAVSKKETKLALVSTSLRAEIASRFSRPVTSVEVSSDGTFVAAADGTPKISLLRLAGGGPHELRSDGLEFQQLAIAPVGGHVAALGQTSFGGDSALVVWQTADLKQLARLDLKSGARKLCYSQDGSLIAVAFADGHCEVYDAATVRMLESIPAIEGLETIAFTQDGKKLLLARQDGSISIQSLLALGRSQASGAAIVSASFHRGGKYLLCGSMNGGMTLWNRAAFKAPQAVFQGLDAPINQSKVSSDGRYVLSVYEDADNSTCVWDLDASNSSTSKIEPKLIIKSEVASSSAAFTSDSKFLLVGGSDGVIRAWSLADNREIARFEGHQGPVMDISPVADAGHFVSGGIDHSIRSWRFPSSLPPPGADIPQGALADATEVKNLEPPKSLEEIQDGDPNDAARQALIAGAGTADILDLMDGDENAKAEAKQSLARVIAVEKSGPLSGAELSQQRRRLAAAQRRLAPTENSQSLQSFAEGFSNLSFVADSNFKFGLDRVYRPVRLLFADRFLYAARTSATRKQTRRNEDGELEEIDEGDNGALLSWDYRYSRLQAHAWSIEDLAVSELYPLPNSSGVFTVPQVILFSQDGSSRELADIANWAASNQPTPQRQFLAVGTAGAQREENDILKVFDVADLSRHNVAPTSQYRSFEGVVTAMAFANKSPHIAFSVRERAVHRLFIADAETLQLTKLEEYNHDEPWIESDDQDRQSQVGTRRGRSNFGSSSAAPGITSLAFSPEDSLLVAQGEYNKSLHKFSRWTLSWNDNGELESFRKSSKELENEGKPFFLNSGSKSIWFITKDSRRQPTPSADTPAKGPDAGVLKVLVRVRDGFSVVNLNSQKEEHKIKFLKTHHGIPEYTISDDGRWLMMGDDNGLAYIWDTYEGTRFCISIDAVTEQRIQEANGRRLEDIPERPAHTGPIVGVALSEPDPGRDYPAFAATIGEENKLKVWELYSLLDPETGLRSTNVARSVTRTINTTALRRRDR